MKKKLGLPGFYLEDYKSIFILYAVAVLAISVQSLVSGPWEAGGSTYTQYNNYIIYKHSFLHLISNQDLYAWHTQDHWDLFKYSPSFAVFFGLFAYLPDALGLVLWNLLNAYCLFFAVQQLPRIEMKGKILILSFLLVELTISLQNSQSNALIAGLLIGSFAMLENQKYFLAALCLVLAAHIKVFALFAFILLLFYPAKRRMFIYALACFATLIALPLLFISFTGWKLLYLSWFELLVRDHSSELGISAYGWLNHWFGLTINMNLTLLAGLLIFASPFFRVNRFYDYFSRLQTLASILLWIVIFNHMAESPTYIIAMAGVGIWYFSQPGTIVDGILVTLAFIFTSLSQTELFPGALQDRFIDPYVIKAVPCIIIWLKLTLDAFHRNNKLATQSIQRDLL